MFILGNFLIFWGYLENGTIVFYMPSRPLGTIGRSLRVPQGLAGKMNVPIVHWRAFLFYSAASCIHCLHWFYTLELPISIWGVGVADVVKALVHHVGIATVWVRVQGAANEKKGIGKTPAQNVP